jgi:hypothetical protein
MSLAPLVAVVLGFGAQTSGFVAPPIWSFDGSNWGGIKLGVHKDSELKKLFGAGKGGIRPEALKIPAQDAGLRLDALMDARGGKAKVKALRLEYTNPQDLEPITKNLGVEPMTLYQQERWEDWSIVSYPGKGICALQMNGRAFVFLLGDPRLMDNSLRRFSPDVTDVVERPDPGADWDRIVTYDSVRVSIEQSKTPKFPSELDSHARRRMESDVEAKLLRVVRGPAYYGMGGGGAFNVDVTIGGFNDKGESDVRYSATLTAETPYGPLTVTQSHSFRMKDDYRRRVWDGADQLLRMTFGEADKRIRALGPPPMNSKRMSAQEALMEDLTPEG